MLPQTVQWKSPQEEVTLTIREWKRLFVIPAAGPQGARVIEVVAGRGMPASRQALAFVPPEKPPRNRARALLARSRARAADGERRVNEGKGNRVGGRCQRSCVFG